MSLRFPWHDRKMYVFTHCECVFKHIYARKGKRFYQGVRNQRLPFCVCADHYLSAPETTFNSRSHLVWNSTVPISHVAMLIYTSRWLGSWPMSLQLSLWLQLALSHPCAGWDILRPMGGESWAAPALHGWELALDPLSFPARCAHTYFFSPIEKSVCGFLLPLFENLRLSKASKMMMAVGK